MAGHVVLLLLLLPGEGGGEAAGEDDAQHLHHDEDAAHAGEDHEDDADLVIQPSLYDKQTTVDIDLLYKDPDVGDLEDVSATALDLEQAARVRDGLLGVAHVGVLPVSEPLGTEIMFF